MEPICECGAKATVRVAVGGNPITGENVYEDWCEECHDKGDEDCQKKLNDIPRRKLTILPKKKMSANPCECYKRDPYWDEYDCWGDKCPNKTFTGECECGGECMAQEFVDAGYRNICSECQEKDEADYEQEERCGVNRMYLSGCGCMGSYPEDDEERKLYAHIKLDKEEEPVWCRKECAIELFKDYVSGEMWCDEDDLPFVKAQLASLQPKTKTKPKLILKRK